MIDQYPYLGGTKLQIVDGQLSQANQPLAPTTESVLVVGTALDGPVGQPVPLAPGSKVFGAYVDANGILNGATLPKGVEEARVAGCTDIRGLRLNGIAATGTMACSARVVNTPAVQEDNLGTANGNIASEFILSHTPVADTTSLTALIGGISKTVPTEKVTVNTAEKKVTLAADAVDSESPVTISYSYEEESDVITITESGSVSDGVVTPFIAHGADQEFTLSESASGVVNLYADASLLPAGSFTIDGKTLTLKPGFAIKGALITASYGYFKSEDVTPRVDLEGFYPGALYNEVAFEVKNILATDGTLIGKNVIITKPESKRLSIGEKPMEFSSLTCPTLKALVDAINAHPDNNVIRAAIDADYESIATRDLEICAKTNLMSGDDEMSLTRDEIYTKLGGTRDVNGNLLSPGIYQLLENYRVDYIALAGIYADDKLAGKYDRFDYQLALACAAISLRGDRLTHGFIATRSPKSISLTDINNHVTSLTEMEGNYYILDPNGQPVVNPQTGERYDIGYYITVVAGPDLIFQSQRAGILAVNSAPALAGVYSALPMGVSPINAVVSGARGLRYTYSNYQRNRLVGARFITFTTDEQGNVVIEDAMTRAQPTSDYQRFPAFRAIKLSTDAVRRACRPFRSLAPTAVNQNAMGQACEKELDKLVDPGPNQQPAILGYQINLVGDYSSLYLRNYKIELKIVPPMETKEITTVVSLAAEL
jgi:hypothetical protein